MSARILAGGGLLGGACLDNSDAQPSNTFSPEADADVVGAMVELQGASEEFARAMSGEARLRCAIESIRLVRTIFPGNMPVAWADDLACELEQLEWGRSGLARKPRDRRGAPPQSTQTAVLRIFACAYMSMLIGAGMRVPQADAAVKQRMRSRFRRVGVQLGPHTLKNWRKRITSEKMWHTDAEVYRWLMKPFDSRQPPDHPRPTAKAVEKVT